MEEKILLTKIQAESDLQPRVALSAEVTAEYALAMQASVTFPPLDVFFDGTDYWLADGYHRRDAAMTIGLKKIVCTVHEGTRRDALLFAVGANAAHGLRRTNEDKRRAVLVLLQDENWGKWTDSKIARHCAVSQSFVSELRRIHITDLGMRETRTFIHPKTGRPTIMQVGKIGRPRKSPSTKPPPGGFILQNGKEVEVKTNKEVEDWEAAIFQALTALEHLSSMTQTPAQYLATLPPYMEERIEAALDGAWHWLQHFHTLWRRHHDKARA